MKSSLVMALLCVGLTACGGRTPAQPHSVGSQASNSNNNPSIADPNPGGTTPLAVTTASPSSAYVTYMARYDLSDPNKARWAWPGSAVGATFTGTTLTVDVAEEAQAFYSGTPVNNWYDVEIDGNQAASFTAQQNVTTYPIVNNLTPGKHTVWLRKRTESSIGVGQFLGFQTGSDGNFLAPPTPQTRRIEFIGDSILTGYGATEDDTPPNICSFTPATENADFSYARFTADALHADFINVSYSGKGISRNLSPQDTVKTLPYIHDRITPDDPNTPLWDYSKFVADIVVLDAGGNDWNGTIAPDHDTFVQAYAGFIQAIRSHYTNAPILCLVSTNAPTAVAPTMESYIKDAIAAANDNNTTEFPVPSYDVSKGYGCDYHPDELGAMWIAKQLAPVIAQTANWQ